MMEQCRIEGLDTKIRKLRVRKGLTQQELSDRIGMTRSIASIYESGSRMPTYGKLIKLARELDVSTDYLLGVENDAYLDLSCLNEDQLLSVTHLVEAMK